MCERETEREREMHVVSIRAHVDKNHDCQVPEWPLLLYDVVPCCVTSKSSEKLVKIHA